MSEPITFPAGTRNARLPLLYAGQAQKEFFVNQALTVLDALSPRAVVASLSEPPAQALDGDCFRITDPAAGSWSDKSEQIAISVGGSWHFVSPAEGTLVFDRAAGYWLTYRSGWQFATAPAEPAGGTVVDVEARTAIAQLLQTLEEIGWLAPAGT